MKPSRIRTSYLVPALALAAMGLTLGASSSASALSCQRQIINRGTPSLRVQRLCGEPAQRNQSVVERSSGVLAPGPSGSLVTQQVSVSVLVERWIYDFGPRRLMQELTFEDGTLVRIRTLGRGTRQAQKAESAFAPKNQPRARLRTLPERHRAFLHR